MRDLDKILKVTTTESNAWICQKYIEQPQLIHGYKFDIRQWVLVSEWRPLKAYIWEHPYVRFAGKKYDGTLSDLSEFQHLTNNSIIYKMDGFGEKNQDLQADGYMWFRQQYEEWLHQTYCRRECHKTPWLSPPPYTLEAFGLRWEEVAPTPTLDDNASPSPERWPSSGRCGPGRLPQALRPPLVAAAASAAAGAPTEEAAEAGEGPREADARDCCENLWATCIWPQIKQIVLVSLRCAAGRVKPRQNTTELFGYDFMICPGSGRPRVWLIEVNSSPALDYSTPVTCPLVKKVMEDTARVMVDLPEHGKGADIGEWTQLAADCARPVSPRPSRPPPVAPWQR